MVSPIINGLSFSNFFIVSQIYSKLYLFDIRFKNFCCFSLNTAFVLLIKLLELNV